MPAKTALLFCREFARSFHTTGAVLPSGKALACALVAPLESISTPRRILEAGPGTGAVTDQLIRRLVTGDELVLCEINTTFADHLEQKLLKDADWRPKSRQITLVRGDVRDLLRPETFDLVVSGLPLNNFSPGFVRELLDLFMHSLRPGGVHTFFEYQALRRLRMVFGLRTHREEAKAIESAVRETLSRFEVEKHPVLLNIPPAWVYAVSRP